MESLQLTARQTEVILLAARGCDRHEIAKKLGLSPKTVDIHVTRACKRLGIDGEERVVLLIHLALRRGWISVEQLGTS